MEWSSKEGERIQCLGDQPIADQAHWMRRSSDQRGLWKMTPGNGSRGASLRCMILLIREMLEQPQCGKMPMLGYSLSYPSIAFDTAACDAQPKISSISGTGASSFLDAHSFHMNRIVQRADDLEAQRIVSLEGQRVYFICGRPHDWFTTLRLKTKFKHRCCCVSLK